MQRLHSIRRAFWYMIRETASGCRRDNVARLAASLAFYTVFSLAPLLIIVVGIASIAIDQTRVVESISAEADQLLGYEQGQRLVATIVDWGGNTGTGLTATLIGLATLLVGATGVFAELNGALNKVWNVEKFAVHGIALLLRARLLSFAMILVIGFLLLVSLIISTMLSAVGGYLSGVVPGTVYLLRLANFFVSTGFITLLFALIYRYLPDARIAWRDVWVGAAVTAVLFTLGKTLIGLYLGNAPFGAAYGAAGSLAVILVWVYFSSQIVLIGAEFTEVYSRRYGSRILSYAELRAQADRPPELPAHEGTFANH